MIERNLICAGHAATARTRRPVLTGVSAAGRLDGVLFELTLAPDLPQ